MLFRYEWPWESCPVLRSVKTHSSQFAIYKAINKAGDELWRCNRTFPY